MSTTLTLTEDQIGTVLDALCEEHMRLGDCRAEMDYDPADLEAKMAKLQTLIDLLIAL